MMDNHMTRRKRLIDRGVAAVCFTILAASTASAQNQAPPGDLPDLATAVAFPNLSFNRPVAMARIPGDRELIFVVEQRGVIVSFPNDPSTTDKQVMLDIHERVNSKGNEEGLLGLAFHPKFAENGEFYVYYSAMNPGPRRSIVSRFRASKDNPRRASADSEEQIWVSKDDPFENHNGGCVEFGPDGYLYISLGDSGAADDPLTTGQNPKDWFGSILRIDVDHPAKGKKYGIPADNPAKRSPKFKEWAPEVYCIGLRNVWKFTFDRATGACWAGDVGQNIWEEIDVIVNGGNYGWSYEESFHPFHPRTKVDRSSPLLKPIVEYKHDVGQSVTGGYVYRGEKIPALKGAYVYGDFQSGRIWALRADQGKLIANKEIVDIKKERPLNIAAFGEDADGELYILAFDGKIHKFVDRK